MIYRTAADIIVILHLLWIIFLLFGAFIGRKHKWVKRIHIGGMGFAFAIQIFGWFCPLTYLEIWLRKMHDPSQSYSGSFIIYYAEKIIYINLNPGIILALTIAFALVSVRLYFPRKSGKL